LSMSLSTLWMMRELVSSSTSTLPRTLPSLSLVRVFSRVGFTSLASAKRTLATLVVRGSSLKRMLRCSEAVFMVASSSMLALRSLKDKTRMVSPS